MTRRRMGYVRTRQKPFPWMLAALGGGVAATVGAVLLLREPIVAAAGAVTGTVSDAVVSLGRTPQAILAAVAKINPAGNPILQPGYGGSGYTWCNKFLTLVTKELGAPIPQMLVNDQADYVADGHGWVPISRSQAPAAAMAGQVVVAMHKVFIGHGHGALVLPYPTLQIAQAGRTNFNQGSLAKGFGTIQPAFYAHS